jgi:hypothetical protein
MSVTVTMNGQSSVIPQTDETGWGDEVTAWIRHTSTGTLQKTGGTFTLTADVDFDSSFGLKAVYYKSRNANPAAAGQVRLGNTESVSWRNAANNADLALSVDSSNRLTYNGNPIEGATALTATRALVSDAGGAISASTVTTTELQRLAGITSTVVGVDDTQSLTNKTFQDSTTSFADNADATKKVKLEVSGVTTGTTRTMTVPDADTTLVGTGVTQTLSNKTFSDAPTLTQISTPSAPSAGTQKYYPKSDGLLYTLNSAGVETAVGAVAGGSKNYLTTYNGNTGNGNFETDAVGATTVTGWSKFNTTLTSLIPTGSISAGAASLTTYITVGSGAQLALSKSLKVGNTSGTITAGQGFISDAFTIDQEDQARMMAFKFNYKVNTGATLLNFSGTSSNTWAAYIYDTTNSAWIQPAGVYNLVQNSGTGLCQGTFQTTSNSTQYRIALVCINANTAGATDVILDDFQVGPQTVAYGPAVSDWTSYTPTLSAGFGTTSNLSAYYRRVGDSLEGIVYFSAGTVAASLASVSLPSGVSVDSTKIPVSNNTSNPGSVVGSYGDGTSGGTGLIITATATSTSLLYFSPFQATANNLTPANAGSIVGNTAPMSCRFVVPASGWSSNSVSSADTDTRVVSFSGNKTSTQAVTSNVTDITFTSRKDTHAAWSGSAYVVPVSGDYVVAASLGDNAATAWSIKIYKNASAFGILSTQASGNFSSGSIILPGLVAGDSITLRVDATTTISASALQQVSIFRLSGPATITATETVACKYMNTAGTSITNSLATVPFATKIYDTHGAFSSGVFTAPVSGKYRMTGRATLQAVTNTGTQSFQAWVLVTSTPESLVAVQHRLGVTYGNASSTGPNVNVSADYQLNAGDTIALQLTNSNTVGLSTETGACVVSFTRIGN